MKTLDLLSLPRPAFDQMRFCVGGGSIECSDTVRLSIPSVPAGQYANAQLDDYHCNSQFAWQPPVHFGAEARFSATGDELDGTAGFGFWNDPVWMTGRRRFLMPQSVWFFFAGNHSYLPLVLDYPGAGWRAAALNAATLQAGLVLPAAPLLALALRVRPLRAPLWRWLRRILRLSGQGLDQHTLDRWHRYDFDWQSDLIQFAVDERVVGRAGVRVTGPLGLVVWIDNQFMVATPQGNLQHGTAATPGQWLEIASLEIRQG